MPRPQASLISRGRAIAEPGWRYAVAGALMVGGPFLRYLYYERYPLFTPEAFVLVTGLALVGGSVSWVGWRLGRMAAALVFALLMVVFIDFEFKLPWTPPWFLIGAGCLAASVVLARWRALLACLVLGTFYLTSLPVRSHERSIERQVTRSDPKPDLRPIVHVVLDGQLGIGGLRATGDTAAARELASFYTDRGFDLYPAAYSRYLITVKSVPAALSLGLVPDSSMVVRLGRGSRFRLMVNPYFALLNREGRRVHVYQSSWLDYCHTPDLPVEVCNQVSANSITNLSSVDVGWKSRAFRMLGYYGFHEVQLVRLVSASTWRKLRVYARVFAARGIDLFHSVEADLGPRSRSSDAYFVHNLLPHAPYEVKEDCTPRPPSGLAKPAAYRAQIVCVHRHLGFLLDSVDRVFGPNRAIVIVHGDHGNREFGGRMSDGRVGSFGAAALNLAFASLLAVRYPGSTGAVHPEPVPLQDFLWAFVGSRFTVAPPGPWKHFVYGTAERDSLKRVIRPLDPSDMMWAPLEPARPGSGTGLGRD